MYNIEEINQLVLDFTGYDCSKGTTWLNHKDSKKRHLFFRFCFENSISGTKSSYFCNCKSRYTAWNGRKAHIKKCKTNWDLNNQWLEFKKFVKNRENENRN